MQLGLHHTKGYLRMHREVEERGVRISREKALEKEAVGMSVLAADPTLGTADRQRQSQRNPHSIMNLKESLLLLQT